MPGSWNYFFDPGGKFAILRIAVPPFQHTGHMKKIGLTTGIPPLIIIGALIVIFPIFTFMTLDRINRQKDRNVRLLLEKGSALVRAFEAASYTGMAGHQWTEDMIKNLLVETAALPDIAYLFVVDRAGKILIHDEPGKAGLHYGENLNLESVVKDNRTGWRIVEQEGGEKVFEMYKPFAPLGSGRSSWGGRMGMMGRGHMHAKAVEHADSYKNTIIFLGLDMEVLVQADRADTRHAVMMAAVLALIGFSGFVLVYMVQRVAQARSSLSRMQVFSENLVENMPMGLLASDTEGQVVSVNPSASRILNLDPGMDPQKLTEALPETIRDLMAPVPENMKVSEREIRLMSPGGGEMVLAVVTSPLRDRENGAQGGLLLFRDITELSRLKDEMEENRRLAAIGRLAAGVAHEIRNPLSSLKGYAFLFKEVFDKGSENYGIAEVMINEVDRLNRVVSELVELARPVAVSSRPVDLSKLVEEIAGQLSFEKGAEEVEIKTRIDSDLPEVNADADRLRQVLLNLGLNAIEAMDDGGHLDIGLSRMDGEVALSVSDTGCGMTEEQRHEIFQPYFSTKLSGTGLGLAIVNNIVKAHNGRIEVESEPGRTRFTVFLPL